MVCQRIGLVALVDWKPMGPARAAATIDVDSSRLKDMGDAVAFRPALPLFRRPAHHSLDGRTTRRLRPQSLNGGAERPDHFRSRMERLRNRRIAPVLCD